MDGISAAASIFAALDFTAKFIRYLKDFKHGPKECQQCQAEASNLKGLLNDLFHHMNQEDKDEAWRETVFNLATKYGPIDQYKSALEQLLAKADVNGRNVMRKRLLWTFTKDEVRDILVRIERLKGLLGIALNFDHL